MMCSQVCAVFLIYWSPQLKQMDFQQLMLFMQKLPTGKWRNQEIATCRGFAKPCMLIGRLLL